MDEDPVVETIAKDVVQTNVPDTETEEADEISDAELDELLDGRYSWCALYRMPCIDLAESLSEFGKHVHSTSQQPSVPKTTPPPSGRPPRLSDGGGFGEMFSSELAADTEAQIGEAMKVLSDEDPELWREFEMFAKSMGLDELSAGPIPPASGVATRGESSVDGGDVGDEGGEGGKESTEDMGARTLDQKLEETVKRLQENAAQAGVSKIITIIVSDDSDKLLVLVGWSSGFEGSGRSAKWAGLGF